MDFYIVHVLIDFEVGIAALRVAKFVGTRTMGICLVGEIGILTGPL